MDFVNSVPKDSQRGWWNTATKITWEVIETSAKHSHQLSHWRNNKTSGSGVLINRVLLQLIITYIKINALKTNKKIIHITFSWEFIPILIRFLPSTFSSAAQAAETTGCVYKEPGKDSSALLSHLILDFKREGDGSFEVQIGRRNAVIRGQVLILNFLSFHGTDVNPCHLTALGTNLHHILPPTHTIIYTPKSCMLKYQQYGGEGKSTCFCCHHQKGASQKPGLCPHQAPGPHPLNTHCPASSAAKQEVRSKGLTAAGQKCWEEHELGVQGTDLPFIRLRYSWHIWSYVVFTESAFRPEHQVKEKLQESINNKLFDLRALLPISAFSLHCKMTQNKGVVTLCTLLQKETIHFRKASGRKDLD